MRTRYPGLQNDMLDRENPVTHEIEEGTWRQGNQLTPLGHFPGRNLQVQAKIYRDQLLDWVNGPGAVAWQADRLSI